KSSSSSVPIVEFAKKSGAPSFVVEKAKELEEEYKAKGKPLTVSELSKIARSYGIDDSIIQKLASMAEHPDKLNSDTFSKLASEYYSSRNNNNNKVTLTSTSKNVMPTSTTNININIINTSSSISYTVIPTVTNINGKIVPTNIQVPQTTLPINNYLSNENDLRYSELAEALGFSEKLIEKARSVEARAAAQGKAITLSDLCDMAQALGIPQKVIDALREADKKATAEGKRLTLNDVANIVESTGEMPEMVAKLRVAMKERNLGDKTIPVANSLPLAPINGTIPMVNSTLTPLVPLPTTTVQLKPLPTINKDAQSTIDDISSRAGSPNAMKSNMFIYGISGIIAFIIGIYAYKYFRHAKKEIKEVKNTERIEEGQYNYP
ncbi:hypothetical protein BCR32DRAFT_251096, partial [Anaeromyces robustus]